MPIVPVQLPQGIERDATPYDSPNRWWDMNLVRWQSGSLRPINGWQRTTGTPLSGAVRKIGVWRGNDSIRHVLVGTDNKLYTDTGGYTDITPTSFTPLSSIGINGGYGTFDYGEYTYGTARAAPSPVYSPFAFWTFGYWGEDVILTANSDGYLYYYVSGTPTVKPTKITTAPTGNNAVIVTEERHVMAIGCGGERRRVGWSSREDYTDWDFTSITNTAGYLDLAARTPLQKAVKVKEGILIFSLSEVYLAQYVGAPYIYSFQRIADTALLHPDAICTFNGKAAWMTRSGFWVYDGGFAKPLSCPVLNDVMGQLDPTYGAFRAHGSNNGTYPELWWFYPSTGNNEANRYVLYNYVEDWWAWGSLSRSAMSPADVYRYPYMGSSDGNMYEHENGWTDAGNSRVGNIWIESGMLGIGQGDSTIEVRQVMPGTGFGYGSVNLTMYSRMAPEGAERTFGPYPMGTTGYTDVRVSGRDARIRFAATADGDWSVGKTRFDVTAGTGR